MQAAGGRARARRLRIIRVQVYRLLKAVRKLGACERAEADPPAKSTPEEISQHLVRSAWRTHTAIERAAAASTSLELQLERFPWVGDPNARKPDSDWESRPDRARMEQRLEAYGIDAAELVGLAHSGAIAVSGTGNELRTIAGQYGARIRETTSGTDGPSALREALSHAAREATERARTLALRVAASVLAFRERLSPVELAGAGIGPRDFPPGGDPNGPPEPRVSPEDIRKIDWCGADQDDRIRSEINGADCDRIVRADDNHWVDQFKVMLDGPTLDEDENAMLKVLGCLPCERVRTLVARLGKDTLLYDFDGSEWDALMLRLKTCGLAGFNEWDDDATRKFINESSGEVLSSLSVDDIRLLILNMFAGSTGDDDENAILRLLRHQSLCTIKRLLTMPNLSFDDFDDEVDGDEWDALEPLLEAAQRTSC